MSKKREVEGDVSFLMGGFQRCPLIRQLAIREAQRHHITQHLNPSCKGIVFEDTGELNIDSLRQTL